jgi:hypothetical protein
MSILLTLDPDGNRLESSPTWEITDYTHFDSSPDSFDVDDANYSDMTDKIILAIQSTNDDFFIHVDNDNEHAKTIFVALLVTLVKSGLWGISPSTFGRHFAVKGSAFFPSELFVIPKLYGEQEITISRNKMGVFISKSKPVRMVCQYSTLTVSDFVKTFFCNDPEVQTFCCSEDVRRHISQAICIAFAMGTHQRLKGDKGWIATLPPGLLSVILYYAGEINIAKADAIWAGIL